MFPCTFMVSEVIQSPENLKEKTTEQLKDILDEAVQSRKEAILEQQVQELKECSSIPGLYF